MASQSGIYARWRAGSGARLLLQEHAAGPPPERLLHGIWFHQRLRRAQLRTFDGQTVRVLHPGFWNRESGPDFRGAVVQIGQAAARSGDVEIDPLPHHWRAHQHDQNPAFANVILHVVWAGSESPIKNVPGLALEGFLDAPLAEIEPLGNRGLSDEFPEEWKGACSGPLNELAPEFGADLVRQAAGVRFQRKAADFAARARTSTWEQALWEGLFRGLGYKQNVWPMQRMAELIPSLCESIVDTTQLQGRLLGVAGLLPSDLSAGGRSESGAYLRRLWDSWWRERDRFQDLILPRTLWRFHGLRPANQPHRRLALAAHWLTSQTFFAKLDAWFRQDKADASCPASLLTCLQPEQDDFWSWHWGLTTSRLAKPQPLLGATRATDLAINVILPWYWARARSKRDDALGQLAWERYLAWPPAQDNAVLNLARRRLFSGRLPSWLRSAAGQQGLLQIVRDFCDHSNAICTECPFPQLVRAHYIKGAN